MWKRAGAVAFVGFLTGLTASPGLAQTFDGPAYAFPTPNYGNMLMGNGILNSMRHTSPAPRAGGALNGSVTPPAQQDAPYPSQAQVNAVWQALRPEYQRRVRLYGEASANRWLIEAAREMGRQNGMRARQAR